MKKTKKIIFNLIFFIALIVLTFYILLKDQDLLSIFNLMINSNKMFILIAIFCMLIYLILEGVNLLRTLKISGNKSLKLSSALKYAFIGFFFSAITPAASGGQPMQIYYMHRDKVSAADSTLALLMNLSSFQVITISMALISLIFCGNSLQGGMIALFIIGIALNSSALALLIIGVFSRRLSKGLVNILIKIMKKFKIRNIEHKIERLNDELAKYQETSKYIKQHKKHMGMMLLTTLIQIIVYYSIPYWIYRAVGFEGASIVKMIALQAILYATVSGIPLPGAVGVSESGFLNIFSGVFTADTIGGAMLINRGVSFYSFVIISGIVVIINLFKSKKEDKKSQIESEERYKGLIMQKNSALVIYFNLMYNVLVNEGKRMVNILFSGNEKVFDGALTELISITNRTKETINCYIFTMDVSRIKPEYTAIRDEQIDFLNRVVQKKNAENKVTKVDVTELYEKEFGKCKNENAYCTPYTLLRLLADMIPDMPDKLLYLDIDMMADDDIAKLFNIDIEGYEYAAVKEKYGCWLIRPDYINAGMLLLNMKEIRKTGLLKKARDRIRNKKMLFADQSAIFYSTTKKKLINRKFNEQSKFNRKGTVICHFCKRLMLLPYPHTENFKQWHVDDIHRELKCYHFDDDLNEYLAIKKEYEEIFK